MKTIRTLFLVSSVGCLLVVSALLAFAVNGSSTEDLFRSLGILTEVVHLVETEYVDPLNDEALALSLDAGLLESVERWAAAVPAERVAAYEQLLSSQPPFGLVIGGRLGSAAVRQALPGSPAAAAGLTTWEVIERVEGVNTRGRPLWQIRLELRDLEDAGQPVTLEVVDRNMEERREVVLEPMNWLNRPVESTELDAARIVEVTSLGPGAVEELEEALQGADRLVLDLRHLAWGVESEAIAAADLFRSEGELGRWVGRRAGEKAFEAGEHVLAPTMPVVLTGPETEGVGEILAAALAGAGAELVGWPTMGHAPHMRFVHSGDLHLWIPVGQWLRSDGEPINGNGLEPTEQVDDADLEDEQDLVLERALEILSSATKATRPSTRRPEAEHGASTALEAELAAEGTPVVGSDSGSRAARPGRRAVDAAF